jgi:hypothetical protein
MARTAAIVGTATATRNAVDRRSAEKDMRAQQQAAQNVYGQPPPQQVVYAAPPPQEYAPPPPAAPAAGSDLTAQLQQLAQLHNAGVLSDEEFAAAKAKLLAS